LHFSPLRPALPHVNAGPPAPGLARTIGIGEINKPAAMWTTLTANRVAALCSGATILDPSHANIHVREGA
jgi:hypothetical protein